MSGVIPPPTTSSRWGARTKRIVVIASILVLAFALWNMTDVLPLLVVAAVLSYLLWPLVNFIESRILSPLPFKARSLAVFMAFIVVLALFALLIIVIVPVLINQFADVGRDIPVFFESLEKEIENILNQPIRLGGQPILIDGEPIIPLERIQSLMGNGDNGFNLFPLEDFDFFEVLGAFLGSLGGLTAPAFSVLGGAFTALINLTFLIIIMFYFMRDGEYFTQQFVRIIPESYRGDVRRLLYEIGRVWNAYLRGQLTICILVGLAVYIACLILGLPNAPMLGLLAGLLEFIPNLGPILAAVPAVLIALFAQSSTMPFLSGIVFAVTVIVVYTVIQQIESYVLVPRVMGGSLNLHPLVVILALLIGASLGGAIGVILAAPFTATLRILGQYIYGKVFDVDPFPRVPERDAGPKKAEGLLRVYHTLRSYAERINWPQLPFLRRRGM